MPKFPRELGHAVGCLLGHLRDDARLGPEGEGDLGVTQHLHRDPSRDARGNDAEADGERSDELAGDTDQWQRGGAAAGVGADGRAGGSFGQGGGWTRRTLLLR